MNIWAWLSANAVALQSLSALVGLILTVATIIVLVVTWRAIKIQANAARALTEVAKEQTQAARDAAIAAQRQADLIARQTEMNLSPLLVAEPDDSNFITGHRSYRLVNRGQGLAFQVHYWEGHVNARHGSRSILNINPSTLAPGVAAQVVVNERLESWTARYKGIDDQERFLMVYLEPWRGQQHIIRVAGEEKTLDL